MREGVCICSWQGEEHPNCYFHAPKKTDTPHPDALARFVNDPKAVAEWIAGMPHQCTLNKRWRGLACTGCVALAIIAARDQQLAAAQHCVAESEYLKRVETDLEAAEAKLATALADRQRFSDRASELWDYIQAMPAEAKLRAVA